MTDCLKGRHFLSGDSHFGDGIDHEQSEAALLEVLRGAWHFNTVTQLVASIHASVYAGIDPKLTNVIQPPPASLTDVTQFSAEFGEDFSDDEADSAPAPVPAAHALVAPVPRTLAAPAPAAIHAPVAPVARTLATHAPAAPASTIPTANGADPDGRNAGPAPQVLSSISRRVPQAIHSPMAPMLVAVATLPPHETQAAATPTTVSIPPTAAAPPFASFSSAAILDSSY